MDFINFKNTFCHKPVEEYPNNLHTSANDTIDLSIVFTTYNHKDYVSQALDSILMQETSFRFEIIVGDDESTDGTREICIEYAKKYPDRIRLLLHHRANNIKVLGRPCFIFQFTYNLYCANGKYIAFLSGDDYWTDKNKLQKQFDFMEQNPQISYSFHKWAYKNENNNEIINNKDDKKVYPMPSTLMYKNIFKSIPPEMLGVLQEDDFILFMLETYGEKGFVENIKPTIYRLHDDNVWNKAGIDFKRLSEINTSIQILKTFQHSEFKYKAQIKLYKSLIKYLGDNRTKNNKFKKLNFVLSNMYTYQLLPSILKLEGIKWKSRIQNQLKINAIKSKVKVAFIKKNGITLNSQTPQIFTNTSVNIDSGVYATKSKYILDSFFGENKIKNLSSFGYTNIINETDYFCNIQHGPWDNYYHWYIDSLPRIWGLHKPDLKKLPTIKLFLSKMIKTEDEKILQAILPDNVVIVKVPRKTLVKGNHAIYLPFLSKDCSGALDKEYLDFYLQKTSSLFNLNTKNNYPSKIYISRKNAEKRKFLNENEVIALVKNEGYTVVELEKLNIAEQAALFYHAKKIVAQHGAALTNLLYAQHTSVVEIFHAPNQHLNHYRDLCSQKELDYTPIYLDGKDKNENLSIDLNYLKTIL